MKCPYCYQEHPEEIKVCPNTGKEIPAAIPPTPVNPPEFQHDNIPFIPAAEPSHTDQPQPTLEPLAEPAAPPPVEPVYAAQAVAPIGEAPAPAVPPFAAISPGLIKSRNTWRPIFCCCLPIPLLIMLLIGLFIFIDPLQYHLWGRLNGTYDAAAEVMPPNTDLYLGFNIGNALLTRVDKKIVVATPAGNTSLPSKNGFQNMPAKFEAEQQISLPGDFINGLGDSLGIKIPQDLLPWVGQYGGIAVLDIQTTPYGTPVPTGWIIALESRNNRQADAFLDKIAGNLAANRGILFKKDAYRGVSLYVQDLPDTDYAIAFGRSGRMLLFASNLGLMRDLLDGKGKATLPADADYQKLVALRPRTWSASLYLSHKALGDYLDQLLQSSPASSALDSVTPFSNPGWTGALVNATVIPQGLRFDTYTTYDLSSQSEDAKKSLQVWNSMPNEVIGHLPQDTLVYVANSDFSVFWKTWFAATGTQNDPTTAEFNTEFEKLLGFSLQDDLLNHLTGQWALYAVPSTQGIIPQTSNVNLSINLLAQAKDTLNVETIATGLDNSILLGDGTLKSHAVDGNNFYELVSPGDDFATLAFGAGHGYFALGTDLASVQEPLSAAELLVNTKSFQQAHAALPKGSLPTLYLDLQQLFTNLREGMSAQEWQSFEKSVSFLEPYEMLAISNRLVQEDIAHNSTVLILAAK